MGLMVPQSRLQDAHLALLHVWRSEGERWRDEPRRRFSKGVIEPADHAVRSAAAAMDTMGEALAMARADCE